jgi:dienelactone hydrolase
MHMLLQGVKEAPLLIQLNSYFRLMKTLTSFILALLLTCQLSAQKTITFPSDDGLTITADLYLGQDTTLPFILLCHQAGYSRGEYNETAKKFMRLGYNCLAIDLRSGGEVNGVKNMTFDEATKKRKGTGYMDAEQDISAAVDYLYERSKKKVVLVGSSYSASLVLKVAVNNFKVSSVIAFSPGEYFGKKVSIKDAITSLDKPVLVLCAAKERDEVNALMQDVKSSRKNIFSPSENGEHGSTALWKTNPNYHDYWISVMMFLEHE